MNNGNPYHDSKGRFTSKGKESIGTKVKENKRKELLNNKQSLNIEHLFPNNMHNTLINTYGEVNITKTNKALFIYIKENKITDKKIINIANALGNNDTELTDDDAEYLKTHLQICIDLESKIKDIQELQLSKEEINKQADIFFEKITKNKNLDKTFTCFVPQGKPSAGKSTTLEQHAIDKSTTIELDNDDIKAQLNENPKYREYIQDGDTVCSAQFCAKQIENKVLDKLLNEGYTFIFSKLNLKPEKEKEILNHNYKIEKYTINVSNAQSYCRMVNRYLEKMQNNEFHRYIPFDIIYKKEEEQKK